MNTAKLKRDHMITTSNHVKMVTSMPDSEPCKRLLSDELDGAMNAQMQPKISSTLLWLAHLEHILPSYFNFFR